jgi:hypothetical protein
MAQCTWHLFIIQTYTENNDIIPTTGVEFLWFWLNQNANFMLGYLIIYLNVYFMGPQIITDFYLKALNFQY